MSEIAPLDIRRPQKHFKYPQGPLYNLTPAEAAMSSKNILYIKYKTNAVFFDSLKSGLKTLLHFGKITRNSEITCIGHHCEELYHLSQQINFKIHTVPCDIQGMTWQNLSSETLIYLAQPQWTNGFFYPEDTFLHLYQRIRSQNLKALLVVDESLLPICWSGISPGSAKPLLISDPNLFIIRSLHPALSPHEDAPTFVVGMQSKALESIPKPSLTNESMIQMANLLQSFERGEGLGYSEFQRRQLALRESIKLFSYYARPLLIEKFFEIPEWPEAAFYLLLKLNKKSNPLGLNDIDWVKEFESQNGIAFTPGTYLGAPGHVRLCFAGSPNFLRKVALRLALFYVGRA